MPSLAQLRALAAARRGEAPQSAQLALVPNDDKDELLSSFRRPGGGREAGAPAPVEDAGPPAAAAPAAAALSPIAMTQRLRGTRVAVVDTETTGIDPLTCEVVEVAVVIIPALGEPGEPEVVLHQRVRPSQPIPADASKVHGITDADVADCPTWAEVAPRVAAAMEHALPCAYNAAYDGVVLRDLAEWGRWIDPLVLVRGLDQFERGKKLKDAAGRRGVLLADGVAHGAAADAMVTAMLLPVLVAEAVRGATDRQGQVRFQAPAHPTVRSWLGWQRDVALAQERELVEFRAQSGSRDPVDCPWHRLEGVEPPKATKPPPPRTATCQSCGAPIVWVVTTAGAKQPCDPPVRRLVPRVEINARREADPTWRHPGAEVALVSDNGTTAVGHEDPEGSFEGRQSHFATCPHASRHRKGGERG